MEKGITYVGMDVDRLKVHVAMLLPGAVRGVEWEISAEEAAAKAMVRKVIKQVGPEVVFCYEAGSGGYALQRQIGTLGVRCVVVAPSMTPVKPGDRIKTDRRDARKLAELLRAGLLTEVKPPTLEQESIRDLCRCREDLREDLLRSRHRLSKMLLRRGYLYRAGRAWTLKYFQWLRTLKLEQSADAAVLADYLLAIQQAQARLEELNAELTRHAESQTYREVVGWLRCFRGIDVVTAMTILAEIYGIERFDSARKLMAYLGLVPSEHSSADRTRRSRITKAGNSHARRVLIETSHHYRHAPAVGAALKTRRRGQPEWVIALADKAQQRLHRRFKRMLFKGKPYGKIIVAIARELVGFVWAALCRPKQTIAQAA